MNIEKLVRGYVYWSGIKPNSYDLNYVGQGFLELRATTKNKKVLNVFVAGTFIAYPKENRKNKELIKVKRENTIMSLVDNLKEKLKKRSGFPGYRGYFQITNFEPRKKGK